MPNLYMSIRVTYRRARHIIMSCFLACMTALLPHLTYAQTALEASGIDPRLEELVQTIKSRADAPPSVSLRQSPSLLHDEANLHLIKQMQTASFSGVPETIFESISEFNKNYKPNGGEGLSRIAALYTDYAKGLEDKLSSNELQDRIHKYTEIENWFVKYIALEHLSHLHGINRESQAALQKSQLALSVIPKNSETNIYTKFAKSNITLSIARLHNLQGNSSLALSTSLEYLKLTKDSPNREGEIDLINNLIFAYGLGRDHEAQLFLSEHLLGLEKTRSSNVPGLSEMRIAGVMNDVGRFEEALDYATKAYDKAENPVVMRNSKTFKAIALAGLGRTADAKRTARTAGVDFSRKNMLEKETRKGTLYLAFLLAQKEDPAYATQLFNRQLDVTAQNFLSNNSRDTTAMLAELENSRERQAEREAAAEREAELQALTIDRQRALNRALIILSLLLGGAAIASFLFMKFRMRIVGELEEKTIEAASAQKLKTEFLGMISHELRTPLNGIIGISDFLAHYHEDPDIRNKTRIVLKSGQDLLSVVESLTDMARLDAGQLMLVPHDADLSVSLAAVPEPWAEPAQEKGLAFTHFVDPAITEHHIDEERLLQCLNILLSNAIRFTKAGRVHLHITADKSSENEIIGLTAIVADTGQGMSELVQSRLFTPFMQADTSLKRTHMGTGLSLAIAYGLAERMNGTLSVFSRETRGSEFKLQIPLAPAKGDQQAEKIQPSLIAPSLERATERVDDLAEVIAAVDARAEQETAVSDEPALETASAPQTELIDLMQPRAGQPALHEHVSADVPSFGAEDRRILVVDNHEPERRQVASILNLHGHICSEAADSFAALDLLEQMAFDVIILDIHLTPIDGAEVLRRIRKSGRAYANIPAVVITANDAVGSTAECMSAGADLFLTKPVRKEELLQTINFLQFEVPRSGVKSAAS